MASFVMFSSVQDVEDFRASRRKIEDHFGSSALAAAFLDGLIDWDGNEICDYCGGACKCGALDWPLY